MFGALVLGLIPHAYDFEVVLEDIKDLNSLARQQQADVCKVSFYA
ncbi:MAG: MqnA/MqnD/SBP family protein, partial [Sphingobacteriia bacterium]